MKMVAAAGLRRAQGLIGKSGCYQNSLLSSARRVAFDLRQEEEARGQTLVYPKIMTGSGKDETYLLIVVSSDKGLRIMINPVVMPMYALYITYKERRPTNDEIKVLYNRLTSKDSIVTKAHEMDMPVENYIHWLKNNVE